MAIFLPLAMNTRVLPLELTVAASGNDASRKRYTSVHVYSVYMYSTPFGVAKSVPVLCNASAHVHGKHVRYLTPPAADAHCAKQQ